MASKTGVCNMALAHLGVGQTVSDIDTEDSAEAKVCRVFWDSCLRACLRDRTWPFTKRFQYLSLIEEDPTDEWGYSYRYPNACLFIRRVFSGQRNDTVASRVSYIVGSDDSGMIIYVDDSEAQIEYSALVENPALFPADFELALSFRLATYIAPTLTRGDPSLGQRALEMYLYHAGLAVANGKNEEQLDRTSESEFITARE